MSYTLAAAASATGLSQTIILRAIKDGRIVGTKDEHGEWHIEPAELSLLVPSIAEHGADGPPTVPDVEELGAQIEALLRQAGDRLRRQLDDVHRDREDDRAHDPDLVLVDQRGQS
jgi:hypothetical protein